MAYFNTILHQIASLHDFENLAEQYHGGQKFRSFNWWTQFMAIYGQKTAFSLI